MESGGLACHPLETASRSAEGGPMKTVKLNLNDEVRVKLTDLGKYVYYHRFDKLHKLLKARGVSLLEPQMPRVDPDGFTTMQLWSFIELYGNHIGMAKPKVIDPISIFIELEENEENGCPYCDATKANEFVTERNMRVEEPETNKWTFFGKRLKFCPMCGRRLSELPKEDE